jgi:hypothetical protein
MFILLRWPYTTLRAPKVMENLVENDLVQIEDKVLKISVYGLKAEMNPTSFVNIDINIINDALKLMPGRYEFKTDTNKIRIFLVHQVRTRISGANEGHISFALWSQKRRFF